MPPTPSIPARDAQFMRLALRLARRAQGCTSPNPMVGAVLVKKGKVIGQGWHHKAGGPHAEIEALQDAEKRAHHLSSLASSPLDSTLYVTLEPCCTHGRTPPCTSAIIAAGIQRVVVAATDPNPAHAGRGFAILRQAGIQVDTGLLAAESARLNEAFNHWIIHRTPFVTVKAAMTLDGKIATASGDSKWITGARARAEGMRLRLASDAILVGINTVLADDPSLTLRSPAARRRPHPLRRIILDSRARTPLTARVVTDDEASATTIVVTRAAPKHRVAALARHVQILTAPAKAGHVDLRWLLGKLGEAGVSSLLVEGGGAVNGAFLLGGLAHKVAFFYAPKILGGHDSRKGVSGPGARGWGDILKLASPAWRKVGEDLMLTARIIPPG